MGRVACGVWRGAWDVRREAWGVWRGRHAFLNPTEFSKTLRTIPPKSVYGTIARWLRAPRKKNPATHKKGSAAPDRPSCRQSQVVDPDLGMPMVFTVDIGGSERGTAIVNGCILTC